MRIHQMQEEMRRPTARLSSSRISPRVRWLGEFPRERVGRDWNGQFLRRIRPGTHWLMRLAGAPI